MPSHSNLPGLTPAFAWVLCGNGQPAAVFLDQTQAEIELKGYRGRELQAYIEAANIGKVHVDVLWRLICAPLNPGVPTK